MSARPGSRAAGTRGFTLIEVMVALMIVALGMSALLEALSVSAGNVSALRDKTVAEWIAMNKIADARVALNFPPIGTTQGDIADCAHGTWHWRQDVSAVSAIPGLINITVSVRRTGNSVSKPNSSSTARRGLRGPSSLGATGPLGSVQSVGADGCIANAEPGGSLGGNPSLGAPGTLGASPALNAAPQLGSRSAGPGSLGASGALGALGNNASGNAGATVANGSALAGSNAAGALGGPSSAGSGSAGNSSDNSASSDSSGAPVSWLVTLTGFRGNSLGAASGESPNWIGSAFANVGSNQNGNAVDGNGNNGGLGSPPTLGPQTPPANGAAGNSSAFPPESPR
jgi:type II secretion system protein I